MATYKVDNIKATYHTGVFPYTLTVEGVWYVRVTEARDEQTFSLIVGDEIVVESTCEYEVCDVREEIRELVEEYIAFEHGYPIDFEFEYEREYSFVPAEA